MRLGCRLFGHQYYVSRRFGPAVRQLRCKRCNGIWGMNDRTKSLIEWDGELDELHGTMDAPENRQEVNTQ